MQVDIHIFLMVFFFFFFFLKKETICTLKNSFESDYKKFTETDSQAFAHLKNYKNSHMFTNNLKLILNKSLQQEFSNNIKFIKNRDYLDP